MNPLSTITVKELRPLLRSRKAFWLLLLALVVLGGLVCIFWTDIRAQMGTTTASASARFGRLLFFFLSGGALCAFGIISALITATAVTAEREAGTLDLLLSTGLSRPRILAGKLAASLAYQLLLALCMTPILILPFMLGGIGIDEILFCTALILITTLTYGMLGLAVSCWMRRSTPALLLVLFLVFTFALLIPFTPVIVTEVFVFHQYRPSEEFLFPISPLMTFTKVSEVMIARTGVSSFTLASSFRDCAIYQLVLNLIFILLALRGFARRAAERPITSRRQIDDPAELDRRRRRWPFYLIDPLRRPQAIPDGRNPLYIKEKRLGALSRPQFFIRVCYLGGLLSVLFTMMLMAQSSSVPFTDLAITLVIPLALLALSQSSFALVREREEKTFDLLRSSPLPARAIIQAKFFALLRLIILLTLSLLLMPLIFMALVYLLSLRQQHYFVSNTPAMLFVVLGKALVFALALAAFYAALGLYCSARSRRGISALVATFGLAGALGLAPFFFDALDQMIMTNANIRWLGAASPLDWLLDFYRYLPHDIFRWMNRWAGSLVSPFYYLEELSMRERFSHNLYYFREYGSWPWSQALVHALEMAALTWLTLRLAARRLERAK